MTVTSEAQLLITILLLVSWTA